MSFDIDHFSFGIPGVLCRQRFLNSKGLTMKKSDQDPLTLGDDNEDPHSTANELEDRLVDFAVRIIKLASALPNTPVGRHVSGQILRSGTSPAPNYGEARGAESRADFTHKIRVVLKELNETRIWLRIIDRSRLLPPEALTDITQENTAVCKIFASSLKTIRLGKNKSEMRNVK